MSINYSLLHIALMHYNKDISNLLISYGSDIFAKKNYGMTALHFAYESSFKRAIKLILSPDVDANLENDFVLTALQTAVQKGINDLI
ncbi:ankyrin repeat protein, putative [Trichomonas vaginalis G3]|uniref:Ankyrin repeat protein, putative n=1 Tax=Trichomonas vaginalis (strain ATCC PRA-98 / G3) TaxID=412133 RepID=A2F2W9_TRIV3|nr:Ankyrin repeat family [Trichomonas vaginalis G3]EAY00762.1 ankyrin repeat protein, putative [Trichomonas vaginalis G3]KAI5530734.1 Ankyrin repeat family [Trichomonas vaginalis G3]|eukprot:XP_001313691.1 ankyrin repeat protein [Trichomonas vaginalis G3]